VVVVVVVVMFDSEYQWKQRKKYHVHANLVWNEMDLRLAIVWFGGSIGSDHIIKSTYLSKECMICLIIVDGI